MKITKISRYEKNKEGQPYVGKFGPYTRLLVRVEERGDKDISFFENEKSPSKEWAEGQEVEFNIKENGQYLNGEYIKKETAVGNNSPMIEDIAKRVYRIEKMVEKMGRKMFADELAKSDIDYPTSPDPDDVPF